MSSFPAWFRTPMKPTASELETLRKRDLQALADRLLERDAAATEEAIVFLEAETRGLWHGRARAMMARRLKHCQLSGGQQARVVGAVLQRLTSGRFSEQFKDQLRLVLHLDPASAFTAARRCQGAAADHVRRYGAWVLSHVKPSQGA
jgi:hypothetical protein